MPSRHQKKEEWKHGYKHCVGNLDIEAFGVVMAELLDDANDK